MLDIMRTENIMNAVDESAKLSTNDKKLREELTKALEITKKLDRTALGVSYHLANCEQFLQGNASGFSTDFVEFCEQSLGVKRAQAFNIKAIGAFVEEYTTTDGETAYIDTFTMNLAKREFAKLNALPYKESTETESGQDLPDSAMAAFIGELEKRRPLGQTQVLTISRAMSKRAITTKDIVDLLQIGTISADTTIKNLDTILNGKFKALPSKATDNSKGKDSKGKDSKTTDNSKGKATDNSKDETASATITCSMLNRIAAVLAIYVETDVNAAGIYKELLDIPELADYMNKLDESKGKAKSTK